MTVSVYVPLKQSPVPSSTLTSVTRSKSIGAVRSPRSCGQAPAPSFRYCDKTMTPTEFGFTQKLLELQKTKIALRQSRLSRVSPSPRQRNTQDPLFLIASINSVSQRAVTTWGFGAVTNGRRLLGQQQPTRTTYFVASHKLHAYY
jgi:hypothetical protein